MTQQAKLKAQAYRSDLKSRALSVLIYLIDRSNKDLTCFPSIATMAEQLHISVSTVKRAIRELVEAGYIEKDPRFRMNRGQSSNLYTLLLFDEVDADCEEEGNAGEIDERVSEENKKKAVAGEVVHIGFSELSGFDQMRLTKRLMESHIGADYSGRSVAGDLSGSESYFMWTGEGVTLIPP